MNLDRPFTFIISGSLLLAVLVLLTLLIIGSIHNDHFSVLTLVLTPVVTALCSAGIFAFFIERFINRKIDVLYRIIKKGKMAVIPHREFGIREDGLGKLSKDTAEWAAKQKKQIVKLKEQAEFRKEFLGNLAHELKTPLFSIQGYILTLLEGGLEDPKVNREFLQRSLSGVDRLSNLLEDLDEINKFETNRYELKIERVDLVAMVQQIFDALANNAKQKFIRLVFDKNYDPVYARVDKNKMEQVFTNLISNAISYGNHDGVTTVRFHRLPKKQLLVEVADNGVGMHEKHFPRLFERFYRVDKSRERNVGGSGLGLAIVKHIIDVHEQTINVRSTEGVGSTFSFTLEEA